LVGHDAPVIFKQVNFSFNQLTAFGEMFVESISVPLVSFGFDTMNNAYRITLDQNYYGSALVSESFNVATRFMPIPLIIALCEPQEFQSLTGGSQINQSLSRRFSVGITGRRAGGINALLTTGHAFHDIMSAVTVTSGGQAIGNLEMFRVGHFKPWRAWDAKRGLGDYPFKWHWIWNDDKSDKNW
jgi:hypothetical protein